MWQRTVGILWKLASIVGTFGGSWFVFARELPPLWLSLLVIALGTAISVLVEFKEEISHLRRISYLPNRRSVQREIDYLVKKGKNILFVGNLDQKTAAALAHRFGRKNDVEHVKITIVNTDPEFYQKFPDEASTLARHDAVSETFDLRFLFYPQATDLLAVTDEADDTHLLFKWNGSDAEKRGFRIWSTHWPANDLFEHGPVTTFDDVDGSQGANLVAVRELFHDYCRSVRDGWSLPVLPRHDWEPLREELTKENLRWYSAAAKLLINAAQANHLISVTWHLHLGSRSDSNTFGDWLLALQQNSSNVDRYLIIDTDLYSMSKEYQLVVAQVISDHFDVAGVVPSARYRVWYVPARELKTIGVPDRDIGLFEVPRGTWAQDSLHETSNSSRRFLRVWFGRTSQLVAAHRYYFEALRKHPRKFVNLEQLIKEYM